MRNRNLTTTTTTTATTATAAAAAAAATLEIGRIYMGNYAGQAPGDLQGIPQSYDPVHGVLYVCCANNASIAVECSVSDSAQKRRLVCAYSRRS